MNTRIVSSEDTIILRELAKQYAEIAAEDVNRERDRRIRDIHGLKQNVRPVSGLNRYPGTNSTEQGN